MAYYGDQGNENYGGKWEPRRSSGGGMSDLPYWILALVFLFAFPPVGVLMIALRLFGGGKRRVARGRHPYYMQRDGQAPVGARTTVSEPARSQEKTGRREKKRQEGKAEQDMSPVCLDVVEKMAKRGRRLIQVGGIITAVFAFTVLAEIRAVNDSIEDAALSAQIDRIGVITAKIFEYQKSHPERSAQLHAFLSYYLPTTLKILRAYAQLESQGVEGENIAAAMSRIEGMMGKVVEGFEKQLDQLFQGDAMDITTDVAVLEQMLQKDGLSSSGGMQIGI